MPAGALALFVILAAAVALFVIEIWAIRTHIATISTDVQRFNAAAGIQVISIIFAVLFLIAGWFLGHFTSPPPN